MIDEEYQNLRLVLHFFQPIISKHFTRYRLNFWYMPVNYHPGREAPNLSDLESNFYHGYAGQ